MNSYFSSFDRSGGKDPNAGPATFLFSSASFLRTQTKRSLMTRCDHCGSECTLPFTCQHCGGKFCPDCRLPPAHECRGIASWKRKPVPSVGIQYGKGGGVSATGGTPSWCEPRRKKEGDIPYLKIMIAIVVFVLLGFAWLVLTGANIGQL
jgi:hypothetical protein